VLLFRQVTVPAILAGSAHIKILRSVQCLPACVGSITGIASTACHGAPARAARGRASPLQELNERIHSGGQQPICSSCVCVFRLLLLLPCVLHFICNEQDRARSRVLSRMTHFTVTALLNFHWESWVYLIYTHGLSDLC